MDIDKIHKLKEEPHLSGAYIRSLVKQLTSSRTKDPMNPKDSDTQAHQTQQPQQHKKQVRRRLHTSRPYQERLLNMAEARREIVTALNAPPPPPLSDNINFALPNQTLGLNLNFHDFNNLDASLYHTTNNPSSIYSSSSPSSSSSPTLSIATEEVRCFATSQEGPPVVAADSSVMTGGGFHPAMDDEEMAEIRWIGEQHQMEWNDNLNLATSAWWFKFLKAMEIGPEATNVEDDGYHPFDEVMDYPAWLSGNESCLVPRLDDCCSMDYLQDPALPCMDIGEIEGMDGEWLA
ncbi:unnamed protein product, partial [Vitis vinifera]